MMPSNIHQTVSDSVLRWLLTETGEHRLERMLALDLRAIFQAHSPGLTAIDADLAAACCKVNAWWRMLEIEAAARCTVH